MKEKKKNDTFETYERTNSKTETKTEPKTTKECKNKLQHFCISKNQALKILQNQGQSDTKC